MKKLYIVLTLAAALFTISCSNQEEYGQFPANEVRFTAAQADVSLSKTVLQSDGAVFWGEGDAINLFYGTDGSAMFTSDNQEPAQQATFTGSLGGYNHNGSDYFHAVYPYSAENTFDGTAFTVTLPEVQSSVAGSFADDLFISLARSQDYTLEFYNLCGGVEFSVAEAGIKYVTFSGNNNEPLAGKVNVIFNDDGKPVVQTVVDGKTELRLDAPNGGTFEPGEWYYIVSLPATLSAGYTMTFYKDEKYAERITDSSISIKRAVWGRLTDADVVSHPEEPQGDSIDLSADETANCYIVSVAGVYSFDASVMGNGSEGYIWDGTQGQDMNLWPYQQEDVYFETGDVLPSKAFVIWDDNGVITDVVYNATTKRISFTATGNKGNALIGLFDENSTETGAKASTDDALWSWHIWCTDTPQIFIMYDDNEYGYEIVDRNLGAISADSNAANIEDTYGFFYQFGRKDPIRGYDGIAGDQKPAMTDLKYSVNHPTYFFKLNTTTAEWFNEGSSSLQTVCADLWGNPAWKNATTTNPHPYQAQPEELKKTIYDPCPPGYMVPPETIWTGVDPETVTLVENGVIVPTYIEINGMSKPNPSGSFYPFAGYISDVNSWEDNTGYFGYNGCTITGRESRAARVYSSYTGLQSPWAQEQAQNHYGGCSLSVTINGGESIDPDSLNFEAMYQINRQRGHNVRCMRGLIVPWEIGEPVW